MKFENFALTTEYFIFDINQLLLCYCCYFFKEEHDREHWWAWNYWGRDAQCHLSSSRGKRSNMHLHIKNIQLAFVNINIPACIDDVPIFSIKTASCHSSLDTWRSICPALTMTQIVHHDFASHNLTSPLQETLSRQNFWPTILLLLCFCGPLGGTKVKEPKN